MSYCVLIALLMSLLGIAGERLLAMRDLPSRAVWAIALMVSLACPTLRILSPPDLAPPPVARPVVSAQPTRYAEIVAPAIDRETANQSEAWSRQTAFVQSRRQFVWPALAHWNQSLKWLWLASIIGGRAFYLLAWIRLRLVSRAWTEERVNETSVLIADDLGPAVVGFLKPQIVLPRWLLQAASLDRTMALAHEREHVAAKDPLLRHAAFLLVALAPWNLPLWWQLRRLRFAIEVDCDRRVLRRGTNRRDYGEMLLSVGQRQRGLIGGVLALTEKTSELERRIWIITGARGRGTLLGFVSLLTVSISLAVAAQRIQVPNAATTSAKSAPEDSTAINGTIVDAGGQPVKDATVFVYSARLKQGYAIVCPTCWIDCGKRADTDAQGRFAITGLNPSLKFRLLIVKDGFTAAAKGGVDPAQGSLPPIKISPRASSPNDSGIVHGRVTDVAGKAIAGALVEPVGTTQGDRRSFGTLNWIDPLAVTNASGEFAIVATQPVDKIMLKISPRALAPLIVTESPGPAMNSVVLTEGATIMGRLVEPNGNPVAHAEMVMTSHDRINGEDFSDVRVGTSDDGAFVFTNVPARRIWGIYPAIESLQNRNLAAGPYWCETLADRQVVNVGKIALHPGLYVSGKIDLPDKKDVPPGMHVSISPDWSLDNRLAEIASDGTFEFKTLAPGIYSLQVGITGYTPTAETSRELLVERDRGDVVIHMARSP